MVRTARSAVGSDGRVVVLLFDPHPISVLRPDATPPRLTYFQQRRNLLLRAGADEVVTLSPTKELLGQEAKDFIRSIVESESPAYIVEGSDFRFGKGRTGSVETLREHERLFGYRTVVIDPVDVPLQNQQIVHVSSTMVRWLLAHGRVEDAQHLLGRPYELECPVIKGDQRGRTIGMPTANLDHGDLLLPADGIYAGRAIIQPRGDGLQFTVDGLDKISALGLQSGEGNLSSKPSTESRQWKAPNRQPTADTLGRVHPAAISIGTKPTFGEHPRVCEAHLIGYDGPLDHYGWTIRLEFHHWLRDQLTYTDLDPLLGQLRRDIDRSAALLGGVDRLPVAHH